MTRTIGIVQGISYLDPKGGEPVSVVAPDGIVFVLADPQTGAPMLTNLTARPGGQAVFVPARNVSIASPEDRERAMRAAATGTNSVTTPLPPGTRQMVDETSARPTAPVRPGKPRRKTDASAEAATTGAEAATTGAEAATTGAA